MKFSPKRKQKGKKKQKQKIERTGIRVVVNNLKLVFIFDCVNLQPFISQVTLDKYNADL